jgi:hypothetical protein
MNLQTQRMVFNKSRDCSMAVRGMTVQNTNTQLSGNTVSIASGGDTTYKGVVVHGDQVTANVGGNLNLSSLQDTCHVQVSATLCALNFNPCFFKDQPLGAGL